MLRIKLIRVVSKALAIEKVCFFIISIMVSPSLEVIDENFCHICSPNIAEKERTSSMNSIPEEYKICILLSESVTFILNQYIS
jgi:hypothetical protein